MRAVLTSFGSVGDIQPFLALATHLARHDHMPVLALVPQFRERVESLGLAFAPIGPDLRAADQTMMRLAVEGSSLQDFQEGLGPFFARLPQMVEDLQAVCRNADVLICLSELPIGRIVHELTGIPFVSVDLLSLGLNPGPRDQLIAALINPLRARLGLRPVQQPLSRDSCSLDLVLMAVSELVVPTTPPLPAHYTVTGFFALEEERYVPDPALAAFLEDGPPPVVVSFGSMVHDDPEGLTELMLTVIERVGCRAVIQQGWSGLRARQHLPPGVHLCGVVPHSWLFPRAACVIHHGGMGTAAATFRAGVPSVVVPHMHDQFQLASTMQQLRVAPAPVLYRELSAPLLQAALQQVLHEPRYCQAAQAVSATVRAEPGARLARERIEQLVAAQAGGARARGSGQPQPARRPPGPDSEELRARLPELKRDWLGFLTRCAREHGDVARITSGPSETFLISSPDLIETVLIKQASLFQKDQALRPSQHLFGEGLLTSEGEFWLGQRRLIQPAFHRERIAAYGAIVVAHTERLLATWADGARLDLFPELAALTLPIVAQSLFSADSITRADADDLAGLTARLIRERQHSGEDNGDLLSMLLFAEDEDGNRMPEEQVRDEVMTMFLAGYETTALALSWTWYLLAQHPSVNDQLLAEIRSVLGDRLPTSADIPQLRYTEMVFKEALRLYPPIWGFGRTALRDTAVGGYAVPAGTTLFMSQWVTQRDPRLWAAPNQFMPIRWAEPKRIPKFSYFPFGGGLRLCIGNTFATSAAVLILATMVPRLRMSLLPGQSIVPVPSLTLLPQPGIKVSIARRPRP